MKEDREERLLGKDTQEDCEVGKKGGKWRLDQPLSVNIRVEDHILFTFLVSRPPLERQIRIISYFIDVLYIPIKTVQCPASLDCGIHHSRPRQVSLTAGAGAEGLLKENAKSSG